MNLGRKNISASAVRVRYQPYHEERPSLRRCVVTELVPLRCVLDVNRRNLSPTGSLAAPTYLKNQTAAIFPSFTRYTATAVNLRPPPLTSSRSMTNSPCTIRLAIVALRSGSRSNSLP